MHWKLVAESSEFHLTPIRAHRAPFSNYKYEKKRDILSEKGESGMALKRREFTPESDNVDTYDLHFLQLSPILCMIDIVKITVYVSIPDAYA